MGLWIEQCINPSNGLAETWNAIQFKSMHVRVRLFLFTRKSIYFPQQKAFFQISWQLKKNFQSIPSSIFSAVVFLKNRFYCIAVWFVTNLLSCAPFKGRTGRNVKWKISAKIHIKLSPLQLPDDGMETLKTEPRRYPPNRNKLSACCV